MGKTLKIICIVSFLLFTTEISNAQTNKCQTYTCYQCSWAGEFKIIVPNIFTPNNDNVNDFWVPSFSNQFCLADYHVLIFNKWGQQLFESTVYDLGWSGHDLATGHPFPDGTYYYILTYSNEFTKEVKSLKGFFQLLR